MAASPLSLSRRTLVAAAAAAAAFPTRLLAQESRRVLAGTYVQEGGAGFVPLEAAPGGGWSAGRALPEIANASFGVQSGGTGVRYLVDEQAEGALGIYGRDFRRMARVSTLGADPCHVALSPDGRALAVANYSSGSVALWKLDPTTGLPIDEAARIVHGGSGPDRERQAGAHAHWVGFVPGQPLLHAVDLGADAVFAHHLDPQSGALARTTVAYRAEPGSGPRHLARHPRLPVAYLVAELANTVTILGAEGDGSFRRRGVVSTLPAGFAGSSAAGHIALNRKGDRLYVSNRGHNSIAVFAVGTDGGLTLLQHVACGGNWPRMFLLLEERGEMLVANQRSGTVASLRIGSDGMLRAATSHGVPVPGVAYLTV
ncbi:lactonase family protein [Sphingomonas desiccabilis]|uniref:Lactonase family protein n=1 Tax=Sphingomonas desiccabilis TaxID=429134 RepID=A0A4Q2ISF5_9SPHN|nr:lactonase family protein [Sphingomonas desiccabilis]MBB3911947.1 6-phosphogluconolactonase [Sphingomonas desiccabilis]RXZ31350.1 lactonase family protein [Sphingomonas desiccabilis]